MVKKENGLKRVRSFGSFRSEYETILSTGVLILLNMITKGMTKDGKDFNIGV